MMVNFYCAIAFLFFASFVAIIAMLCPPKHEGRVITVMTISYGLAGWFIILGVLSTP